MIHAEIIETVNEVGEKRYIEIPTDRYNYNTRREKLEILIKKSQSLFNFCLKSNKIDDTSNELVDLIERARASLYRNDDIKPLCDQYDHIRRHYKRGSISSNSLSGVY
jgi:phosphopantetheine adenylyltransferase